MNPFLICAVLAVVIQGQGVAAQGFLDQDGPVRQGGGYQQRPNWDNNELVSRPGTTCLGPIRSNAYGPGINADATGRPFQWHPEGTPPSGPDPTLRVMPNAYGLGVHADQYGRIVEPVGP